MVNEVPAMSRSPNTPHLDVWVNVFTKNDVFTVQCDWVRVLEQHKQDRLQSRVGAECQRKPV